jgi:beta-glucosidase
VGFSRVELAHGASSKVDLTIDPRLLADWNGTGWTIEGGTYRFAIGENAETFGDVVSVTLPKRTWKD